MELTTFIKDFADQFEDTDTSSIGANTKFHEIGEWSSLTALSILNMISNKYGTSLSFGELRSADTVKDVFDLIDSKA